MSISRWDPWGDFVSLRDAMNTLLEDSIVRTRGAQSPTGSTVGLALDVRETPDGFVIRASTPGMKPEDVQISLLGDVLTIRGEHTEEREEKGDGDRWLMRERHTGSFARSVRLPGGVVADQADAAFDNGVLTVTLTKAAESKERAIAIRGATSTPAPAAIDATSEAAD
jgi:HSP20 family protein